jgi:ADP-heptose:LPS heptosyltransferase
MAIRRARGPSFTDPSPEADPVLEGSGREATPLAPPLRAAAALERAWSRLARSLARAGKRRRGEPIEVLANLGWRLGDEVMALPVYQALKQSEPMVLAARVRYPELLAGNPFVDRVNPLTVRPDLVLELRGEKPGVARRTTLAARAGVALDGILPRVYLSEAERDEPALPELSRLPRPRVALHPGSSARCKEWGRERWREVAAVLARAGVAVVEVGAGREPLGAGLSLVDRTSDPRLLARVLAQVDLVAGDDSGPVHLALAVSTPALAVFGATDPALLYPPGGDFRAVTTTASCRFCWPARRLAYPSGTCPLERHACMDAVAPAEVARAIAGRLSLPAGVAS